MQQANRKKQSFQKHHLIPEHALCSHVVKLTPAAPHFDLMEGQKHFLLDILSGKQSQKIITIIKRIPKCNFNKIG